MSFYVTTPIYYVNDQPHIGHAYTSLAADVLARYNRMRGGRVLFLTGTDEHGQKVQQAAELKGRTPREHADTMVVNFKGLWEKLGLTNDAFIRTTDDGHKKVVQELLQRLWEKKQIVRRTYQGFYCTPCERFWTGKDLREESCPDCLREVELIEEDNYFFLMSGYHDRLVSHIEANPGFILPETRRNEVLGFLRTQPLGDLCISRPSRRLSWGIPLPFDEDFVTYVWFDALINYYSATRYLAPADVNWWPASVQIIGKDILTTHAVYWSSMLMALGLELPSTIFAHGWWTVEGRKMSKSVGNVVDPAEVCDRYGTDAFRYFLFREVPFGLDGDFSEEAMIGRINTDLANDLGNLASRTIKMADRYFGSVVPEPAEAEAETGALVEEIAAGVGSALRSLQFQRALDEIWKLVSHTNKYIDSNAPWSLAKDPKMEPRLRTVLYSSLEALRILCLYLNPFLPDATLKLHRALCGEDPAPDGLAGGAKWGMLRAGTKITDPGPLFPRVETDTRKETAMAKEEPKASPEKDNLISIDDFSKVELKTARVTLAERVKGSKKLIRLEVDSGEQRQVVAGIGEAYAPEDLVGKTIVVVTNLKPAKLMGVESRGMLLAATGEDGRPVILTTEKTDGPKPGTRIK